MTNDKFNFYRINEITFEDIKELIDANVEESITLDFKQDDYSSTGKGKQDDDFAKDISAFANSMGGMLILGVAEILNVAKNNKRLQIVGIDGPIDSKKIRLESKLRNIYPPIAYEIVSVNIPGMDKYIIIVATPQSSIKPHVVANRNKYYKRTPSGASCAMNYDELRFHFLYTKSIEEKIVEHLHQLLADHPPHSGGVRQVIHAVPSPPSTKAFDPTDRSFIDVLQSIARKSDAWHTKRFYSNGWIASCDKSLSKFIYSNTHAITVVKHFDSFSHEGSILFEHLNMLKHLQDFSESIHSLSHKHGITTGYCAGSIIDGCGNTRISLKSAHGISRKLGTIQENCILLDPILVNTQESSWHNAFSPWAHKLWNAAGYASCDRVREDGTFDLGH